MQQSLVRKNKSGALEYNKRQACEDLFDYADGRITGCQTTNTLPAMQEEFDEGCFDDQFALSLFNTAFIRCLVVVKNGFSIYRDTEDG
jgi:hypothetical protein